MAGYQNLNHKLSHRTNKMQTRLKCIQINLQHSRLATDNLLKIIEEDGTDILFIQEPYTIRNKIAGLSNKYKIFTSGEGRNRAAIVVTNKYVDIILIKQLSDEDAVVLEAMIDNTRLIIASMYFDINQLLDIDMRKIEATIAHAKGAGVVIAMDSNSRSNSWHDILTNRRGKMLEEFLMSKQLHILNEESCLTTFRSSRGTSNIDLTVINNHALDTVREWEISDQESCSDHSIIKYVIGNSTPQRTEIDIEVRYKVTQGDKAKFQRNLILLAEQKLCEPNVAVGTELLDRTLCTLVAKEPDMDKIVEEFHEVLDLACRRSFKISRAIKTASTHKSVPWWSEELTILRKRVNALRRRYQRTRNSEELREQRRAQYLYAKAKYAATIRKEKTTSWKEYCSMTSSTNPWNEIYRIAAGKRKHASQITTLRKPDGTLTANLHETLKYMLEHFTPEDSQNDDSDNHRQARTQSQEPINTADDKDFTVEEIKNAVASMGNKKAPGEDGITGEIYKSAMEILPRYITAIYNGCLRRGTFPKRWKRGKIIPITKPGKEKSEDVSKFRPISLLNIGGKVLEKALISRINRHVFSQGFMNTDQYGFTPQKGTIDAAMKVKDFVMEGLAEAEVIVLVSLDVKGAFDAAWWPRIQNGLRACDCPENLYNLSKSYFSKRTAILLTNSVGLEREISKGYSQGSCCGPGIWNIQYNSLVNLNFKARTKVVAFADDFLLAIRGESVRAAETYSNGELSKIEAWSKNKITFNEEKSQVMLVSRRK